MILYGIPNCDSTKRAIGWLKKKHIPFTFHNYKESGISAAKLKAWCASAGWEAILNKRSSTWRSLSAEQQQQITDTQSAIVLMLTHNSIIKRPILEYKEAFLVGFDEKIWGHTTLV
ncbi:MAG: Spx/MgsR family RNA polymerase-binding regulatory protein [Bacteroidetes bacterium]|nr:Spx/MgsR family RNA polymerase-binding regulatory protein [Bacteroidota bacterium]